MKPSERIATIHKRLKLEAREKGESVHSVPYLEALVVYLDEQWEKETKCPHQEKGRCSKCEFTK